jgi:hypothetical protein
MTLNVTDETDIQGEITSGMIVRVEILLLSDGTWEVLSIAPLGESTDTPGCATVIATVVSVNGNEIQFLGWPTTVTFDQTAGDGNDNSENTNGNENNDNGEEGSGETVSAGQVVLAVVCVSEDGQLVIVQIVVLNIDMDDGGSSVNGEKVLVCHKPDKKGGHTLSIPSPAVPAHLGHGDTLGPCP